MVKVNAVSAHSVDNAAANVFRFRLAVLPSGGIDRVGQRFRCSELYKLLKFGSVHHNPKQHAICMWLKLRALRVGDIVQGCEL